MHFLFQVKVWSSMLLQTCCKLDLLTSQILWKYWASITIVCFISNLQMSNYLFSSYKRYKALSTILLKKERNWCWICSTELSVNSYELVLIISIDIILPEDHGLRKNIYMQIHTSIDNTVSKHDHMCRILICRVLYLISMY